ncbi:hypothetical protein [Agromyces arachidis]|uniref:hypothetical protein n=1 Tax=Agromyces arachidis TaxID=766966 RepID=UPI004057ACC5
MIRRTRAAMLPALVIAASLALAACAPSSDGSPTPTASEAASVETASPTPDAPDPEPEVAAILVRADAVEYFDGAGEPIEGARDPYAEPVDAALARLTDLLGEPAVETYESQFTEGTGTFHRWNGLAVMEYPVGMVAEVPDAPTWGVQLDAAAAGGLRLVTVDGLAVGDPAPDDLERTACNSLMAEIVGTRGVAVEGSPTVRYISSPISTDVCE